MVANIIMHPGASNSEVPSKDLYNLTVERLRALLKARGLSPKGKKASICYRNQICSSWLIESYLSWFEMNVIALSIIAFSYSSIDLVQDELISRLRSSDV